MILFSGKKASKIVSNWAMPMFAVQIQQNVFIRSERDLTRNHGITIKYLHIIVAAFSGRI